MINIISMKVCNKCGVEKEIDLFPTSKNQCKKCISIYSKKYRETYIDNRDQVEKNRIQYLKNKERFNIKSKKWYNDNTEYAREMARKKYRDNREYEINRSSEYHKKRMDNDPVFRLKKIIRGSILQSMRNLNFTKKSRSFEILGCSFEEFIIYLNDNLYGFTYEEGIYDLDHIIPISTATTEEEVLRLNHYMNFQLLPSEYNRNIKRANMWNNEHFEEWLEKTNVRL